MAPATFAEQQRRARAVQRAAVRSVEMTPRRAKTAMAQPASEEDYVKVIEDKSVAIADCGALSTLTGSLIVRSFVLILTRNNGSELKTVQGVGWGGIISE